MSSTGTRKKRSVNEKANESIIEIDKQLINEFTIFSEASNSVSGLPGPAITNSPLSPAGNYLAVQGDIMIGPLALGSSSNISVDLDSSNTLDIGPTGDNLQYTSNVQLGDLQTNSAVLDIIANAAFDGQILVLRTFAPTVAYTISQGTVGNSGNIQTRDGNNITLGDLQTLTLIFDESLIINANTGGTWRVIGDTTSSGGGGDSGYDTIQDEGVAVTQRNTINFIGAGVTAVDNAGQTRTDVTISGGGATALNDLTDVTIAAVSNAQVLIYDSTSSHWENQAISGDATISNIGALTIGNNVINNDNLIEGVFPKITGLGVQTQTLEMGGNGINDILFLNSNAVNLPGSGFIRMGTGEAIRMRNPANTDDLIITSGTNSIGAQAIIFQVASGNQLTISELTLDVVDNSITNTGDITPGAGAHQVGDSTDFYNQMHSQFFVPETAAVITNRYGLSKVGNTLYVNFDNTNTDAGFSIYEEGFESFRFYHPTSNVNEFHMGSSTVFTSGETYRIQMGENSNSSARIELIEGGNDLTLERQGVGTSFGVKLRSGGFDRLYARAADVLLSVPLNVNTNEITNVVNIKSNGGGGATTGTIGELITEDGGFNYFVRDTIASQKIL